jgi:hypothetical protein
VAYTAVNSVAVLCRLFLQRVISRFSDVPWPPCSLDLTAPDFFLWIYLKSRMYSRQTLCRLKCTQTKHMRLNCQHFRRNTSSSFAQLLNSCAFVYSGGWWPPKRHGTQKVKQCTTNLSTVVICNVLKLSLITCSKMLFIFIISSLFLLDPAEVAEIGSLRYLHLSSCTLSDEVSNGNIGQFLNIFNFSERIEDN